MNSNPTSEDTPLPPGSPHDWTGLLLADLRWLALRRPWGQAVMTIGWVHLVFFSACQAYYTAGLSNGPGLLAIWAVEVFCVFVAMRKVAGRHWIRESPTVGLIVRVWITFLILSFNVGMLNTLMGWPPDWFKPVWCTLASFGFATMAWLFGARYLIPAFQMYFTSLLMLRFPEWKYLVHAISWCIALQWVGWDLIQRRARLESAAREVPPVPPEYVGS